MQGVETAQDVAGSTLGTPKPALQSMAVIPSLSLRHMLILQQTGFTAATTNAISTATHVNSTLGTTIQQLQQSVEEVEGVLPEVEAAVDGDTTYDHKKNLLDLEHTVLALEVGPCQGLVDILCRLDMTILPGIPSHGPETSSSHSAHWNDAQWRTLPLCTAVSLSRGVILMSRLSFKMFQVSLADV